MGGVKSPGNRGVLGKDRGQFGPRAAAGRGQTACGGGGSVRRFAGDGLDFPRGRKGHQLKV